ncbi:MAG: ABC transporter ATP-binding protein [Candidatus Thorarchaeota archaeon]
MESIDSVVSISNMTKSFGKLKVLDDLSLDIEPCIFGLIGPNGAGKTTILRILLGLIKSDEGSAKILNNDVSDGPLGYLNQIGVLHENPYYPPSMTPMQYLDDVGSLYPTSVPAEELLEMVGLSDAVDRKIKYLSAGMQRRLGIALALVGEPRLVILDEPTSNLDVAGRDYIVRLIVKMHQENGVSFFLTSHILTELERACHKVAFINKGKIIEKGDVHKLVEKYTQNRFRILSSDPRKLLQILNDAKEVVDVFVDGSSSLIVEVAPEYASEMKTRFSELVSDEDIQIYAIENTGTLEDVYRKVVGNG